MRVSLTIVKNPRYALLFTKQRQKGGRGGLSHCIGSPLNGKGLHANLPRLYQGGDLQDMFRWLYGSKCANTKKGTSMQDFIWAWCTYACHLHRNQTVPSTDLIYSRPQMNEAPYQHPFALWCKDPVPTISNHPSVYQPRVPMRGGLSLASNLDVSCTAQVDSLTKTDLFGVRIFVCGYAQVLQ